jgi:hypothetical protein
MTDTIETLATVDDAHPPADIVREPSPMSVPVRTLPLLLIFLGVGAVAFAFACATIYNRTSAEIQTNPNAIRQHYVLDYWLQHGYFHSAGITVREDGKPYFYKSSTGGCLVSTFVVAKIYQAITGRYGWRLVALHNEVISLIGSTLFGLLGFRLARRAGVPDFHALLLGVSLQLVHFTFPTNLALYWEMTGRGWWLPFAMIFLLLEERAVDRRTRALTIAQALSVFLFTYMEYIAGVSFIASYIIITLAFTSNRVVVKRLLLACVLPGVLALSVFVSQRMLVNALYPDIPKKGSTFISRTGLDGSLQYYGDHLDIAFRRDTARGNWAEKSRPFLFHWPWLFIAGTVAVLYTLIGSMRARVPVAATTALVSLAGAYVIYAAMFSQSMVVHPYLYDVMLITPLILALFVIVPAMIESTVRRRGIAIAFAVFFALWMCMVHLRDYAVWYPPAVEPMVETARTAFTTSADS